MRSGGDWVVGYVYLLSEGTAVTTDVWYPEGGCRGAIGNGRSERINWKRHWISIKDIDASSLFTYHSAISGGAQWTRILKNHRQQLDQLFWK